MAIYAEIHGYVTFPAGVVPAKVLEALNTSDSRLRVFESEPRESFQRAYTSFSGEARLSGPRDDRDWLSIIESGLKETDFFSLVLFVAYEDASTLTFSYFRIGGEIRKSVGKLSEQVLSETRL